jgi:hypothetical protein
MRHVLLVLSEAVEGREDEYNDWYDNVHLVEVLEVPGFVAAQRFSAGEAMAGRPGPPRKYLSIYEIEADDVNTALAALSSAVAVMNMSTAINSATVLAYPYTAHGERLTAS